MRIDIAVAGARLRRWHLHLAARLTDARPGAQVRFRLGQGDGLPSAVELLLQLERMIYRRSGPLASDKIAPSEVPIAPDAGAPDLTILLDGALPCPNDVRHLAVSFDGVGGEAAAFASLLSGRAPSIGIADETGAIVAWGLPSIESARGVGEGYEHVALRAVSLLLMALEAPRQHASVTAVATSGGGAKAIAAYGTRAVARAAVRRLYKLCFHAPHWRVGWRFVSGDDVWDRQDLGGTPWNVLADPGLRFYADPFPFQWRGETWVFAEDLDHRHGRGIISAAPFDARGPSGPMRPVLEEAWHLSYPFLIEEGGELWMVPESSADRSVRLYRCDRFPDRWVEEACLLRDVDASDATLVRRDGRWWMLATTRDDEASFSDTLSIFMADQLLGPWRAHPGNPLLVDAGAARPAGNIVGRRGRLWRPVQDCRGGYGTGLGLAEITRLDAEGFSQEVRTVLRPGPSWPGRRLHTLNRAGNLECIDGSGHSPKLVARPGY